MLEQNRQKNKKITFKFVVHLQLQLVLVQEFHFVLNERLHHSFGLDEVHVFVIAKAPLRVLVLLGGHHIQFRAVGQGRRLAVNPATGTLNDCCGRELGELLTELNISYTDVPFISFTFGWMPSQRIKLKPLNKRECSRTLKGLNLNVLSKLESLNK